LGAVGGVAGSVTEVALPRVPGRLPAVAGRLPGGLAIDQPPVAAMIAPG
jgi:hypothetical protein